MTRIMFALGLAIYTVTALVCCESMTPAEKSAAADSYFAAEMAKCVDAAPTFVASRACRERVRASWRVVDAGAR